MANNVIGVFDSVDTANQVVSDLTGSGFDSSAVSSHKGSSKDIESELQDAGVSADEAREYASSVGKEGALVVVRAEDSRTEDAVMIMNRYYSDENLQSSSDASYASGSTSASGEETFAVAEEQIQIGKREVQRGGVRVRSVVSEKEVEEQVSLRDETIHVDRRPVDRAITDADTNVFNERTVELTETDEEAVVAKDARVVEEVVVGKDVEQRTETVRDTVRRTDVEIDDLAASHAQNLASDKKYSGREWSDVESDAKTNWERDNKDQGAWDSVKDSVRSNWEKIRN